MNPARVLVVGDVMRDIVVRSDGPLRRGTDRRATIRQMPGGSGANQAAWLASCGATVRFLACVAEADLAEEERRLRSLGVEPALVGHPTLPTGQLIALVEADGERSFLTDRGANDGLAEFWLPSRVLEDVAHLHVSGYALVGEDTRRSVRGLMARAAAAGVAISFDPGSAGFVEEIGAASLLDWVAEASLCVTNSDEAAVLTGETEPLRQLDALLTRFGRVLLKRGAEGAIGRDRDGACWRVPAPRVEVVDTIGAGDAFLAGFLSATLRGVAAEASLAQAVAIAARAVQRQGGRPP